MNKEYIEFVEFIESKTSDDTLIWNLRELNQGKACYNSELNNYKFEIRIYDKGGVFFWIGCNNNDIKSDTIHYSTKEKIEVFDKLITKIKGDNFKWPSKERSIINHFLNDNAVNFLREKRINKLNDN